MSSSRTTNLPWPAQTPFVPPASSHGGKRKRSGAERNARLSNQARATIANQSAIDAAKQECFDTDNAILSCWPTQQTSIDQNEATEFVWNSNSPLWTQFNLVDIALIRADTSQVVKTFNDTSNPRNRAGDLSVIADDDWWGSDGAKWDGTNTPFPFYFVVVASGTAISSGLPQSTFTAVQTTFPNSVIASMSSSSVSAAAASASAASVSSVSSASASRSSASSGSGSSGGSPASSTSSTGSVQGAGSGSSFPHWAIAVIVVLGFLALAALIALIFLLLARARRRRFDASRRGSMGSQSPMMANVQPSGPLSPQIEPSIRGGGTEAGLGAGMGAGMGAGAIAASGRAPSSVAGENDGASSHSENLFSGADAAVMAEAFRKALRKPEFGDQTVEEGESPDALPDNQPELLSRELAEEGRDIRSVGSSRGVRVETMTDEDEGDTATARFSTPRNSTG